MLPPQTLPDSQESNASSTVSSNRSFPSNAYVPPSAADYTPPSSQSQPRPHASSQTSPAGANEVASAAAMQPPQYQQRPAADRTSSTSSSGSRVSGSPTHGSKRTASGAVKYAPAVYPGSPTSPRKVLHKRTTSIDTTTSSVGEVGSLLFTCAQSRYLHFFPALRTAPLTPLICHDESAQ